MLSFWTATDPLYTKEYNKYMDDLFYTKNTKTDQSASSLQWRKVLKRHIWDIVLNFTWFPLTSVIVSEASLLFISIPSRSRVYRYGYQLFMPFLRERHMCRYFSQVLSIGAPLLQCARQEALMVDLKAFLLSCY